MKAPEGFDMAAEQNHEITLDQVIRSSNVTEKINGYKKMMLW